MKVELLPNGILPVRKTAGAAAYDLFTPMPLALSTGLHMIDLQLKIQLPPNTFGSIRCRSSLATKGVSVEAGVIDEDYRGEVKVLLRVRDQAVLVPQGHAIAQLIIQPYLTPEVEVFHCVEDNPIVARALQKTERGSGGFGSTDKTV
tara:strand:- start:15 stop:455 length:441 start_codon:yes stop_codon:yes gene_type:complete